MKKYKLNFEYVPDGCWYQNLRSALPKELWDMIRKDAYKRFNYQCAVCHKSGKLEAHERWHYDENQALQTLVDVVALCPACHQVVHIGRTYLIGKGDEAMEHFMQVNACSQAEYHEALQTATALHQKRNKIENWTTDISWIKGRYTL